MAWNLGRVWPHPCRFLSLLNISRVLPHFYSKFDVDVMDEFTSQLMQQKIGKWDQKKRKTEAFLENTQPKIREKTIIATDVEFLSRERLNFLFQNLLNDDDLEGVLNLTKTCLKVKKVPPDAVAINVLTLCAQNGEKDIIIELQKLSKKSRISNENSNFQDFLAQAIWVKGDVSKALEIFENVYRENAFLRRRIRLVLKLLISDLVSNGSGAALGNMINFSERIFRDFQDVFPLSCIWQACFLSEWFTDQTIALELLEKNTPFCKSVINRIPYVVFVSLKCHRTEVVHRLLEILLKQKLKSQYSSVLGALLEYQFRYGDWIRCSEIIKWAVENNVALPQKHNIQLINLLLNQKLKTPLVQLEEKIEKQTTKCDFKF